MLARIGRLFAVAVAALAVIQVGAGRAQSDPPPPMDPDEYLVQTRNCGIIFKFAPGTDIAKTRADWGTYRWNGPCQFGLAHGRGTMDLNVTGSTMAFEYEAVFGRFLPNTVIRHTDGRTERSFAGRTVSAHLRNLAPDLAPVWDSGDWPGNGSQIMIMSGGSYTAVQTWSQTCQWYDQDKMTPEEKLANRGCRSDAAHRIYMVWASTKEDTKGKHIFCPDPRTPVGCEGVWAAQIAPLAPLARQAETESVAVAAETRARVEPLMQDYDVRLAAARRARQEAQLRQQAEAAAAAEAQEKAFQDRLAKGTAGQLFALADEMSEAGDTARQRQALRTLVSRFPDHALATNAAQQLSQMSSPGGSASASTAAPSYSRPAPAAPSATAAYRAPSSGVNEAACKAEVERLAAALNASQPRNAGNSIRQMETLMFVLKAMADTTDAMCPRTQAYINASAGFRKTYSDTARTCGQVSSQGACTPRMH